MTREKIFEESGKKGESFIEEILEENYKRKYIHNYLLRFYGFIQKECSAEIDFVLVLNKYVYLLEIKHYNCITGYDSKKDEYHVLINKNSRHFNTLRINIFRMNDFVRMLDSIAIPYDIVYYLELRRSFFDGEFPNFFINHANDKMTTMARIENEEGMIDYYKALTNGDKNIDQNAIEGFRFIIKNFQERLLDGKLYSKDEYRETLRYLLKSNRNTVHDFILRW